MSEAPRLIATQDGRVLTVRFNNPPRHFFDERMNVELDELTRKLRRDTTIGAVVFTGQDTSYLTHFEVDELLRGSRTMPFRVPYPLARVLSAAAGLAGRTRVLDPVLRRTPTRDLMSLARMYTSLGRLTRMDKVTVAAINGLALGMGCIFSLACDIRLMSDDQEIGLPETALGMLAAAGGTQRLVRTVGAGRALELLLDGRWLSAREAVDIGLVHRAVPANRLLSEASDLAHRLAKRSPVINREIKRMIHDAGTRSLSMGNAMEAASLITTMTTTQAERSLASYHEWLTSHRDLTDDVIRRGWHPLLTDGVPGGPLPGARRTPRSQPATNASPGDQAENL
jgi:enoyl-CoA hydratase